MNVKGVERRQEERDVLRKGEIIEGRGGGGGGGADDGECGWLLFLACMCDICQ